MPVTPGSLVEFAACVHRTLLRSRVLQKRVLPRLVVSHATRHQPIRCHSTETTSARHGSKPDLSTFTTFSELPKNIPPVAGGDKLRSSVQTLPTTCPGCGALYQTNSPTDAGFYSRSRKAVKEYLRQSSKVSVINFTSDLEHNSDILQQNADNLGQITPTPDSSPIQLQPPICDRCHDLVYNNKGQSIAHPSVEDIADSIAESPFDRNHVYHIIDAADFPMSLMPKIYKTLELAKPRSQNRRARTKFTSKPTISFIITRSDLLGPSKQMVDRMMPYFQATLRAALGRQGRDMRLGNVHLVSAKRGWWTKEIKDSIWERGGATWLVGKVNVGKSNLFPVLFPKGSGDRAPVYAELSKETENDKSETHTDSQQYTDLREDSLLPPAQEEVPFPAMPIVSHLPGTTASPIRLPFGNAKGELIDLPGLERGNLETFVHPDHKLELLMQHRPNVQQHVVKPGQSLVLGGGLIRITPDLDLTDRSMTLLAYPFVPIDAHVTSTDKAIAIQTHERESGIRTILGHRAEKSICSSGQYILETDVTKSRAGPLMRAGVPLSRLPFRIYSSDILIEGVGWVELVCQVRKQKDLGNIGQKSTTTGSRAMLSSDNRFGEESKSSLAPQESTESSARFKPFSDKPSSVEASKEILVDGFRVPHVEIFSPLGKHISHRRPLGAWMLWHEAREQRQRAKSTVRPRRSMKGSKKRQKMEQRAQNAASS